MNGPAVLVLNAGSSSLKFALFSHSTNRLPERAWLTGQVEGIGAEPRLHARSQDGEDHHETLGGGGSAGSQHQEALNRLFDWLARKHPGLAISAAGHRIVHGGERYSAPLQLTPEVIAELEALVPLAPLHQPHNLRAVHAVSALLPQVPQVGCFDTAFHRSQPEIARRFALPRAISERGVKRYGFHGLSYDYVARELPQVVGERARGAVVIAHLGNGASMCALRGGRSIATTMGFTALEGLMMGTRTGAIDPGVLLYLMEHEGMDLAALTQLLYKESGLLGVSGISQDMRTLLASTAPEAREAVDLFCYRIARELGSLAAALGGLDALVFTGGIGEHAAPIRAQVGEQSAWLGIALDAAANGSPGATGARRIDAAGSRVAVAVVPTDEERMIARYTIETLDGVLNPV
ncbi:MAG: acetate/propionate family kinase [Rhodocyclaceae bacterium]|nr:acetate/propionate family kinase [Rhodocyclaceae bacterium]